jgi:hypothetical protein
MAVTESNIYAFWVASQPSGKETPATVAQKRLAVVAGDLDVNREDGSENFSDLDRFGDSTDFVNSLQGGGALTAEAQANELAYLCWLFFGTETFTAKAVGTSPPKFEFEPGANIGKWSTWWKRVGMSTIVRRKFNDCRISSLRFEGSTANKVVKCIPNVMSLDPGEVFTADPTPTINAAQDPFIYTEGKGTFTVDGQVFNGHSQFAVIIDDGLAGIQGDAATMYDFVPGNAVVTLDGITMLLDDLSLARYNQQFYGTATPTAGTKPIQTIPALGTYSFDLVRGTGDTRLRFKLELGSVKWAPDVSVPPNPDGGAIELAWGGAARKNAAGGAAPTAPKLIRVTVETGAGDSAAHAL